MFLSFSSVIGWKHVIQACPMGWHCGERSCMKLVLMYKYFIPKTGIMLKSKERIWRQISIWFTNCDAHIGCEPYRPNQWSPRPYFHFLSIWCDHRLYIYNRINLIDSARPENDRVSIYSIQLQVETCHERWCTWRCCLYIYIYTLGIMLSWISSNVKRCSGLNI